MGIELVKAVAGNPATSRLSGNAYKVLVAMALQALDKPRDGRPASLYFGGWEALGHALGYDQGGVDSPAHTAVKRAVRELKEGRHISPMVTASRGMRQSYLVHPGGLGRGSSADPQSEGERGSASDPKRGSSSDPKRGSDSAPKGGHSATHLGGTEEERGLTQDHITHPPTSSTDRTKQGSSNTDSTGGEVVRPHKHQGLYDDPCADCGKSKLHGIHARGRWSA